MTQLVWVSVEESELLPPQADNIRKNKRRMVFRVAEIRMALTSTIRYFVEIISDSFTTLIESISSIEKQKLIDSNQILF